MLLLDLLALIGSGGIVLLGTTYLITLYHRAHPEIKGANNARKALKQERKRCHFCTEYINSEVDIYIHDHWFHYLCYLNQPEEEGN